ncbi:type II secretion system protein [Candidatus Saccharibacteria bacterium]|nr:type II secretion system protein [Candidatus Saccharibacteria bacterium]
MAKQNIKTKKGFTIIEVVLVLAIAGLIFLMVFIAWPALQRSQRDTQRRNDYSMLSTAISNYATNNNGKLKNIITTNNKLNPATYINAEGTDPNGWFYELKVCDFSNWTSKCGTKPAKGGGTTTATWTLPSGTSSTLTLGAQVYVIIGADCTGNKDGAAYPAKNVSTRAFAIYGYLESGTQTFCSASQ